MRATIPAAPRLTLGNGAVPGMLGTPTQPAQQTNESGTHGAASMLTAAYFMLRDEKDYHELGGRYLDDRDKHRIIQRLLRRLHDLGVEVEVKAA